MPSSLRLFDPTPPPPSAETGAARPFAPLAGAVVGFIDNAKPNFEHLVDAIADELLARGGVRAVVKRRKRAASVPAPDAMLAELLGQCDVVIAGSGD